MKLHTYRFFNLEQLLFQCAEMYGAGLSDWDANATRKVNALLEQIDLPFFSPSWKEEAEQEASKIGGVDLYDAATIAGDTFTECQNGKYPDRHFFPWDESGTDETTIYRAYIRMIAGIRSKIPAIA